MAWLIVFIGLLALLFGPAVWVRRVLEKYSQPDDRYQGTGATLARHLLDQNGLGDVKVEATEDGDHYDPSSKTVRLTRDKFDGRSLTAVTVAAHEVGHAIQDHTNYGPLKWRSRLVQATGGLQKLGAGILMISPFLAILTRAPVLGLLTFAGGLLALGSAAVVHFVTLPTEFDASFNRAMPLLVRHRILIPGDEAHAAKILKAAALTYVSVALMSLLNIARWIAILRH